MSVEDPARRAARRAAYKAHHPDIGGEPEALRRALEEVDRRYPDPLNEASLPPDSAFDGVDLTPRSPGRERWGRAMSLARKRTKLAERKVRERIPVGWPGARRYFDL